MTVRERAVVILEEIKEFHEISEQSEDDVIRGIMFGLLKLEIDNGKE